MEQALKFAVGLIVLGAGIAAAVWIGWRTLQNSEDPAALVVKWIVTAVLGYGLLYLGYRAFDWGWIVIVFGALLGIVLGIIWAPSIGQVMAKPFTSMFDGGAEEVEARPFYSIAQAKRKQGKYQEAIERVEEQLQKFSGDYEGLILLAEIYGEDLKDNAGAQNCVEQILSRPDRPAKNIAFALNRSADWHLNLASDREAAKDSLLRIPELAPDTEQAQMAWQRVARLGSDQMLAEQKERPRLALTRHENKVGLEGVRIDPRPKVADPAETATQLVAHLNEHPFDAEAREELAVLYAEHYARLDMAEDQFEQLINSPNPQQKQVVRWLNRLADLHITIAGDRAGAESALRRIIERFPGSAGAANAEKRIAFLSLELNKKTTSQAVQLGSYDQNIGLKGQVPRQP